MPVFYNIDKDRRLVMSTATGILNKEDALAHQNRLRSDPEFDSAYSQLLDFRHVTQIGLTASDIQQLALPNIFSKHSRRAVLVPNDLAFGLGRMFEILRENAGERGIRVFRDLDEALDWVLSKQGAS